MVRGISFRKRLQQATLIGLVAALTVSAFQPSTVMAFFNFNNPATPQRMNVAPLKTAALSAAAKPLPTSTGADASDGTNQTNVQNNDNHGSRVREIESLRTNYTSTYENEDGTKTFEYTTKQQNYKANGNWRKIDNSIGQYSFGGKRFYTGKAGQASVSLSSLANGIDISVPEKTLSMRPMNANDNAPVKVNDTSVVYKNAWPGVDLEYQLRGESVKEVIVLNSKAAQTTFDFEVLGGKVVDRNGVLGIEGLSEDYSFSPLTLDVNGRGVISEERVTQTPTATGIRIQLDKAWYDAQSSGAFPMKIDPTFTKQSEISYKMYKSDGYYCNGSVCYANTGTLDDNGWKKWRTFINYPYSALDNKTILNADLYGWYQGGAGGTTASSTIYMSEANCSNAYSCYGSSINNDSGVTTNFSIDFTARMKSLVAANDFSTWWGVRGVEGSSKTFKPYYDMKATVVYDTPTPMASSSSAKPTNNSTVVTTQPSLSVNAVTDSDGDDVQYYFRVATSSDAETGAIINSGWISSRQWTVPQNILQDGRTYYWHVYTRGNTSAPNTPPTWVKAFKVDMRTGKDSTQAYEDIGPVSVDLATGNATTGASSHSIAALGGDIGVNLSYNSTAMSSPGLIAEYWNNTSHSGDSALTRVDSDVNFDWDYGSPGGGVNADNFSSRWTGYMTLPDDGDYTFGCFGNAWCKIYLNDQLYLSTGAIGEFYGDPITLEAGAPVKVKLEQAETTGIAKMMFKVTHGSLNQAPVPADWLQTGAQASGAKYGLEGRYYTKVSGNNFPTDPDDPSRLLMVRRDNKLTFNWSTKSVSPGLPADNFMVRWKGYITVPTSGSYTLGAAADDGVRIKLGTGLLGADETVVDSWVNGSSTVYGTAKTLTAGQLVPITAEYYESTGSANFKLLIKGPGLSSSGEEIPVTWLAPKANVLPDGWDLGYGSEEVNFEKLTVSSESAILSDSTGQTYEYKWSDAESIYKAPEGQDALLTRNEDETYTVLDVDGKTYIFDAGGKLKSVSSPLDDKQPAALKYEYAGNPSRLIKIVDGVNNQRYGELHYSGDSECDILSGFDTTSAGYICAYTTTDGMKTTFQYKDGALARVAKPGDAFEDYGYDSFGRIVSYRSTLANDAIAYGKRADNAEVTNEVSYDGLGRVESVWDVAPSAGATRVENTVSYTPSITKLNITGANEPHGFSRKIEYDSLFRTVKETDLANLSTITEWHESKDLVISTTDPTGLKATTIYDENDMPIDSYGPAPESWFGLDNRPLAAHESDVPRVKTGYDEGIIGLNLSVFDNKKLLRQPKIVTTGMDSEGGKGKYLLDLTNSDITPTDGLSARATGKLRLDSTGTYSFKVWHSDGARLFIDNTLVSDDWTDGNERFSPVATYNNTVAGQLVDIAVEFYKSGTAGNGTNQSLVGVINQMSPGESSYTPFTAAQLKPDYGLITSKTTYDADLGNFTSTNQYSNPAYGTISSTSLDPDGLNLQTNESHETPGSGYLRQVSKTLPGGTETQYEYYTATDTRDNPCTTETESYLQAGFSKGKTEQDPDGSGQSTGRKTETIYDNAGRVIAMRYNNDSWTCSTFDERGRLLTMEIPAVNGNPGRTITNNYLVNGSPLITSVADTAGTITTEIDMLDRTLTYTDARSNETTYAYDWMSRLTSKISPVGTETFIYDNYDRLTSYKLDGTTFASIEYDQFSRIESVDYPAGLSLNSMGQDSLGRVNSIDYQAGSTSISDHVTRSVSGRILSGLENSIVKQYDYDSIGRLTQATVGSDTFEYNFSAPESSCATLPGNNVNSNKNSNRSSFSLNGQITSYCYDMADRLIDSSDVRFANAVYDTHGNTITLGNSTHQTQFGYDASDRNASILETYADRTEKELNYVRDASDRLLRRTYKIDGVTQSDSYYGYSTAEDSANFVTDGAGNVLQAYLTLPGGVNVTIKPASTSAGAVTYGLSNIHGDIMATVNADGTPTLQAPTGPYGELLDTPPVNTVDGASFAYVGRFEKTTDTDMAITPTQMGARVYIAELGRFLQVDSIEGGTPNNYVYATDPVNQYDLDGKAIPAIIAGLILAIKICTRFCKHLVTGYRKALAWWRWYRVWFSVSRSVGASRTITGWTWHASQRLAQRSMTKQAVYYIVRTGTKIIDTSNRTIRYESWLGRVVLNERGQVVTVIRYKSQATNWKRW